VSTCQVAVVTGVHVHNVKEGTEGTTHAVPFAYIGFWMNPVLVSYSTPKPPPKYRKHSSHSTDAVAPV
jgi:hypothetical protein